MGNTFPWYYNESSSFGGDAIVKNGNIVDYPQLVHRVYDNEEILSTLFTHVLPIVMKIEHKQIVRIKLNLNFHDEEMEENSYSVPHLDTNENNCLTAIFYMNDSDGDTYLFNEPEGTPFNELTVKKRITPKRNSLLVFPSDTLHSGNTPRKFKRRVVININVIPK